jgi:AbrB family looped-hinge helix DNA binding protein
MDPIIQTVDNHGQIELPAAIREELAIEPGTRVAVSVEGSRVILDADTLVARLRRIEELRGITAGHGSGTDLLLEERRLERERELREEGW